MRAITYYVAEDGTKFSDEFECETYELKCLANDAGLDNIVLWDEEFERIQFNADTIEGAVERAFYILVLTKEALTFVNHILDEDYGTTIDNIYICYQWDECACKFDDYSTALHAEIAKLIEQENEIKELVVRGAADA